MTIRIISDHEVALQMKIDVQGKALQKAMNEAIALKAERDTLRQQLAEAQAQIEASRKQEHVAYSYALASAWAAEEVKLYTAPMVAPDVKAARAGLKEDGGIIRNFDFMGFHLLEEKGLRAVISETQDGKRGVLKIEPIGKVTGGAA